MGHSGFGFLRGWEEFCCKRELNTHFNNVLWSNGTFQRLYIISKFFVQFYLSDLLWSCNKIPCYKEGENSKLKYPLNVLGYFQDQNSLLYLLA